MAKESQLERQRGNFFLINGEETQVCQLMFLNTFSVTEKYLVINPLGGECWLRLGVDNVRRLYRIKKVHNKRKGIKDKCILLSDGGPNPWDTANCHLEETAMKEALAECTEEKEYFLRVNNPETPFRSNLEEEIAYSRDTGDLVLSLPEIPRNAFTYMKRSNRTIKNVTGPTHEEEEEEKASAQVLKIVNMVDVTTHLKVPSSKHRISEHIQSHLEQMRAGLVLDEEEEEEETFNEAMRVLAGEKTQWSWGVSG